MITASKLIESAAKCHKGGGDYTPPPPPKPPAPTAAADNVRKMQAQSQGQKRKGFASTILTSGLGDSSPNPGQMKSLLGS